MESIVQITLLYARYRVATKVTIKMKKMITWNYINLLNVSIVKKSIKTNTFITTSRIVNKNQNFVSFAILD